MTDWATIIDEQIKQAIREGQFDNLPGAGKPLKLDDDPNTPPDMRLAHQILRANDLVPNWIQEGRVLDEKRARLVSELNRAFQLYRQAVNEAVGSDTPELRRQRAEIYWSGAQKQFREAANSLNRQITGFNLKLPKGIAHLAVIDVRREIEQVAR